MVSSGLNKDILKLRVLNPGLFKSLKTGNQIQFNYETKPYKVKRQFKSQEDKERTQNISLSLGVQSIIFLIIPLCFNIFMKISIERSWSFYLALQVVTNIYYFEDVLSIPATSWPILRLL